MDEIHPAEYSHTADRGTDQIDRIDLSDLAAVTDIDEADVDPEQKEDRKKSRIIFEDITELIFPQNFILTFKGIERIDRDKIKSQPP